MACHCHVKINKCKCSKNRRDYPLRNPMLQIAFPAFPSPSMPQIYIPCRHTHHNVHSPICLCRSSFVVNCRINKSAWWEPLILMGLSDISRSDHRRPGPLHFFRGPQRRHTVHLRRSCFRFARKTAKHRQHQTYRTATGYHHCLVLLPSLPSPCFHGRGRLNCNHRLIPLRGFSYLC